MNDFSTTIEINTPPNTVWRLLTSAGNWDKWHPTITHIEGDFQRGEKLKISTGNAPNQQFSAKITEFVPNQSMAWQSTANLGLLKTVQTFELTELRRNVTQLTLTQKYKGFLIVFVANSIPDMQPSLKIVAHAIKRQVTK
jgi:hypothetical protein